MSSTKNNYNSLFEEIYQEVRDIDALDKCSLPEALCKLAEEHGELIRAANKTFGRKVHSQNKDEIRNDVKEEIADTLQNLLLVAGRYDFTVEEIVATLRLKNEKWRAQIPQRQQLKAQES